MKLRVTISIDTEELTEFVRRLTPEQLATLQVTSSQVISEPPQQSFPQTALQRAFEAVRKPASSRQPPAVKGSTGAGYILNLAKRKGKFTTAEAAQLLKHHGLAMSQGALRRLMDARLIKKVGLGQYVYTGEK